MASKPSLIDMREIFFGSGSPFNYTYDHTQKHLDFVTYPDNEFTIKVRVVDAFNQTVIGIPDLTISMVKMSQTAQLSGDQNVVVDPETGVATFGSLRVSGLSGEMLNLKIGSSFMDDTIEISVLMGVCEPGFFLKHYPVDNNGSYPYDRCKPCEPGSYNFYHNMTFCHNCPLNAICELDIVESILVSH